MPIYAANNLKSFLIKFQFIFHSVSYRKDYMVKEIHRLTQGTIKGGK